MTAMSDSVLGSPASAGQVFELIRTGRATTRSEVGRVTGLSRTAVTARLAALLESGLVVEGGEAPSTGGRPAATLGFDRQAGVVLAVAVGRSRSQLGLTDLGGTVLAELDEEQEVGVGPDELMPRLVACAHEMLASVDRTPGDVRGVGVSIPGTVDVDGGASRESPILPGWDGVPLPPYFSGFADAPVLVDNDANALAASERDGLLREVSDLLVVKASTGLGAGLVVGGRLVRGAWGAAGELGHVKSRAARGLACRCGETGCLEAVAGGWALVQGMRDAGRPVDHARAVVDLALAGDAEARGLVRESGRRMGEVLAAAVDLLNPHAVVLGGDLAAAFDLLVAGVRESLYAEAAAVVTRDLRVLPATHGSHAGVVGCASLALEAVLSPAAVDRRLQRGTGR